MISNAHLITAIASVTGKSLHETTLELSGKTHILNILSKYKSKKFKKTR